jgi:hypothetical protein
MFMAKIVLNVSDEQKAESLMVSLRDLSYIDVRGVHSPCLV